MDASMTQIFHMVHKVLLFNPQHAVSLVVVSIYLIHYLYLNLSQKYLLSLSRSERYIIWPCCFFSRSVKHCHTCKSCNHKSISSMLLRTGGFNNLFDTIFCLYSSATNGKQKIVLMLIDRISLINNDVNKP